MGLLAGLSGLLVAARVGSVNGNTGNSFEMDAIGACFIGGASAYGGSGTIGGVVIGALLLGVINMGMSIMGIGDSIQQVVKGGVLLIAVIFDVVTSRKAGKTDISGRRAAVREFAPRRKSPALSKGAGVIAPRRFWR